MAGYNGRQSISTDKRRSHSQFIDFVQPEHTRVSAFSKDAVSSHMTSSLRLELGISLHRVQRPNHRTNTPQTKFVNFFWSLYDCVQRDVSRLVIRTCEHEITVQPMFICFVMHFYSSYLLQKSTSPLAPLRLQN